MDYNKILIEMIDKGILSIEDLTATGDPILVVKKKMEEYVLCHHTRQIQTLHGGRKEGWFKTYVGTPRKPIESKSYDGLIEKLYEYYTVVDLSKSTLEDGYDWMIEHKIKVDNITASTVSRNRERFDQFTTAQLKATMLTDITEEDICDSIRQSIMGTSTRRQKAPSVDGIKLYLQILNNIFNQAAYKGVVQNNPVKMISYKSFAELCNQHHRTADEKTFSPEQTDQLLNYCMENGSVHSLACRIDVFSGLREGEIPVLRWSDIKDGYIHVHKQQRLVRDGIHQQYYMTVDWTKDERGHSEGGRYIPIIPALEMRTRRSEISSTGKRDLFSRWSADL